MMSKVTGIFHILKSQVFIIEPLEQKAKGRFKYYNFPRKTHSFFLDGTDYVVDGESKPLAEFFPKITLMLDVS